MTAIPASHIADSHKLVADGRVDLFELTPAIGTGTLRFTPDSPVTWRGLEFSAVPLVVSGEDRSAENPSPMPRLVIGDTKIDLSAFKPLIRDRGLDGARVRRLRVLVEDLLADRNIFAVTVWRVKRVESYSSSKISVQLATSSDAMGFSVPHRAYDRPAFPAVQF